MQGFFSQIVNRMSGGLVENALLSSVRVGIPRQKEEVSDPFLEKEVNPDPLPENQLDSLPEKQLRRIEPEKNNQATEQQPFQLDRLYKKTFEKPIDQPGQSNKTKPDTDEGRRFSEMAQKDIKKNDARDATHQEFRETKTFRVEKVEKKIINNPETQNSRKGNAPEVEEVHKAGPGSPWRAAPTIPLIPQQRKTPAKREAADSKGIGDPSTQLVEKSLLAAQENHSSKLFPLGREGATAPAISPGRQPQQKKLVIGSMKIEVLSPPAIFKTKIQKVQRQNSKPGARRGESRGRLKLRYGFGQM